MSNRNGISNLAAFVLGGAIGALVGILIAPESGEDTRGRIKDWAEDKWDEERDNIEELKEEVEKKLTKKKKQLGKKINKIKEEIAEAVLDNEG